MILLFIYFIYWLKKKRTFVNVWQQQTYWITFDSKFQIKSFFRFFFWFLLNILCCLSFFNTFHSNLLQRYTKKGSKNKVKKFIINTIHFIFSSSSSLLCGLFWFSLLHHVMNQLFICFLENVSGSLHTFFTTYSVYILKLMRIKGKKCSNFKDFNLCLSSLPTTTGEGRIHLFICGTFGEPSLKKVDLMKMKSGFMFSYILIYLFLFLINLTKRKEIFSIVIKFNGVPLRIPDILWNIYAFECKKF